MVIFVVNSKVNKFKISISLFSIKKLRDITKVVHSLLLSSSNAHSEQ